MTQPSPSVHFLPKAGVALTTDGVAWKEIQAGAMLPMMFQLHLWTGEVVSFPYADVRELRMRDAGRIELAVLGIENYRITITGRLLSGLAHLLSQGRIHSVHVADPRDVLRPEDMPTVDSIDISLASTGQE